MAQLPTIHFPVFLLLLLLHPSSSNQKTDDVHARIKAAMKTPFYRRMEGKRSSSNVLKRSSGKSICSARLEIRFFFIHRYFLSINKKVNGLIFLQPAVADLPPIYLGSSQAMKKTR